MRLSDFFCGDKEKRQNEHTASSDTVQEDHSQFYGR